MQPRLLPLLALPGLLACTERAAPEAARAASSVSAAAATSAGPPPLRVRVLRLQPEPLALKLPTVGTLVAQESVRVVSELSRRLARVHVEEGAVVKKGDLLFTLDASDLHAQLRRIEVRRKQAASHAARLGRLFEQGLASEQDLEAARAALEEVRAEAAIVGVTLAKTRIRAPFDGRVGLRRVSEGAWVGPDVTLTTLQDVTRLKVDFSLPERHGAMLGPGARFEFRVTGRPESFEGRVVAVEPHVESSTRSVSFRGQVENADQRLLPGTSVNIEVPFGGAKAALQVPAEVLVPTPKGHAVWRAVEGRARLTPVELGARMPERVELVRGVEPGDAVVRDHLLRLREGAPLVVGD